MIIGIYNKYMKIKVIKTEQDYQESLKLVELLMSTDPNPDSTEGEQLSLLATLIQDYEENNISESFPGPVEAIKFRMEQMDLIPADLIPFIGSRSRVSEILSGKRQLTLEMVRSLEIGLGIPAKVLIRKPDLKEDTEYRGWDNRLFSEMEKRGYFKDVIKNNEDKVSVLNNFFSLVGSPAQVGAMLRKSNYRSSPLTDKRALVAWTTAVLKKAKKIKINKEYKDGIVNSDFMRNIVQLSTKENNPILVQEFLKKHGIILVIEPHFSKTYLDGAVILTNKKNPIIGITLRYDRLDNFWFTLMHELAHISLHYKKDISMFYDEIEGVEVSELDEKEKEADQMAEEILLPHYKWEISPARLVPSEMAVKGLAKELGVHPAIIAGQIRHKGNKYVYLNKIVNSEQVRRYFPNEIWNK